MGEYTIIKGGSLSTFYKPRYIVVDKETGEVLDDGQGYGFKTEQKARDCWEYKCNQSPALKAYFKRQKRTKELRFWLLDHPQVKKHIEKRQKELNQLKNSLEEDPQKNSKDLYAEYRYTISNKDIQEILDALHIECEFTAGEILKFIMTGEL